MQLAYHKPETMTLSGAWNNDTKGPKSLVCVLPNLPVGIDNSIAPFVSTDLTGKLTPRSESTFE
jgi:hypothetical protein